MAERALENEVTLTREALREAVQYLRTETVGGLVMLAATVLALVLANTGAEHWYHSVLGARIGPSALHLDLTVHAWIADGLLALFFFVVGLELKRELAVGQLRNPKLAVLPVFAALGGMLVPGLIGLWQTHGVEGAAKAWAIPLATDIAFALAVLAIVASHLPSGIRIFLLSVAVVDDLGAILIIAIVFTSGIDLVSLAVAVGLLVAYAVLQQLRVQGTWSVLLYVPIGLGCWYFVHASGLHATIAGVALGLLTRVKRDGGEEHSPAVRLEHRVQPFSAGLVVPLFALAAAGITVDGHALGHLFTDPVSVGVLLGLVLGKPIGVTLGALFAVRSRLAVLPEGVRWADVGSIGVLAGIGFTVSLLISELALHDDATLAIGKSGVLLASLIASVLGAILVKTRDRFHAARDGEDPE
ncbi:Na+/H+ antiporter NhaA [Cumulibacter manganitolerans]|uniref:Na+/H+ antiporter NhaA n=1 Tax=Cumulibacter manganitolerans TaxID=1884992 RepID=UPI001E4CF3EE|nr:Na+/H+ antiporter NhaA [Cumulibacter manganitolerans]